MADNNNKNNGVRSPEKPLAKCQDKGEQPARAAPANGQQERGASGADRSQPSQESVELLGPESVEMTGASTGLGHTTVGAVSTGSSGTFLADQGDSMDQEVLELLVGDRRVWNAIYDEAKEEGRELQVIVRSLKPSVLEAVGAKRRRVGNSHCESLEDLPALLEARQPSQEAYFPLDPRETPGESPGRAGCRSGDRNGIERVSQGTQTQLRCIGCGSSTHTLLYCLHAAPNGLMRGCPLCDTDWHDLGRCRKFKEMSVNDKMSVMVVSRRNMPSFAPVEVWMELVREACPGEKPEAYPWSQMFTRALPADLIADLQDGVDSSLRPAMGNYQLAQDPATSTWESVEALAARSQHETPSLSMVDADRMEIIARTQFLESRRRRYAEEHQRVIDEYPTDSDSDSEDVDMDADSHGQADDITSAGTEAKMSTS